MKSSIFAGVIIFFWTTLSSANDKEVWKQEDCKKISDASGHFLMMSGYMLKESGKRKEEGDMKEMDKLFIGAMQFSEMAANYAKTFEVFCRPHTNHKDID